MKLDVLRPVEGGSPLAIVLGEFKAVESTSSGHRVWIRHMPDAPLLVDTKTWKWIEEVFAPSFEARDADTGCRVHLVVPAMVRARREHTCESDPASLVLTNEQWVPLGRHARTAAGAVADPATVAVCRALTLSSAGCGSVCADHEEK